LLGLFGGKAIWAALGFFFGSGVINPTRADALQTEPPQHVTSACEGVAAAIWRTLQLAGFAYAHLHGVKGMAFVETPRAIIAKEAPPELLLELKCDCPSRRNAVTMWLSRMRAGQTERAYR